MPPPDHSRTAGRPVPGHAGRGSSSGHEGWARFAGLSLRRPVECVDLTRSPERVAAGGVWAVVGDFDGPVRAWRFEDVTWEPDDDLAAGGPWTGVDGPWQSSLSRDEYTRGVHEIRARIREGDVYQVNLCRVLSAPLRPPAGHEPDAGALLAALVRGNPAPYAGAVHVPPGGAHPAVWMVSASPELFLRVEDGWITSGPIKGTAPTPDGLTDKDRAENVMIADMVRNDLQRVCAPGTVEVTDLLAVELHPGLAHLVTTVRGRLTSPRPDWSQVLAATYPPASVSGAPKHAALATIAALEPMSRGPYCGAVGWIDADRGRAELAVGIRSFWWTSDDGGRLSFGTGAGITWGSDAAAEWDETELKAARLTRLAAGLQA